MLLRILKTVIFICFVSISQGKAQTIDEILSKHTAATGGLEKWKSLQSFVIISRSESFSFNHYWKKPNRIRVDVPIGPPIESVDVRAFDGVTGWRINPLEGSEEPRTMSAREIGDLQEESDWLRELIDYKNKGHRVELAGKESVEGNLAYKLKLVKSSGVALLIFINSKTFLEVKRTRQVRTPWGADVEQIIQVGDYRSVGGLMLPHRVGDALREYEVNQPIDDAVFKMPQKNQEQNLGKKNEGRVDDLAKQFGDPKKRAQFLQTNPESDLNKDGTLTLEEAWAYSKKDKVARLLLPVGSVAPDWTLKDAKGQLRKLSDYRGKVLVMDFWAVWCIPCHRAMPGLQRLHKDLSKRGVIILGISTGEHGGDPVQVMEDRGYTYELLLNGEAIAENYRVVGLPTIYVIGPDGRIIHAGFGANPIAEEGRRTFIENFLTQWGK
jgi:peroxiredoxin